MAKPTRKSKQTGKITIEEFRAWLQGVEDMQSEGWTPSAAQWAKIRDKLNMIEESTEVAPNPTNIVQAIPEHIANYPVSRPQMVPPVVSTLEQVRVLPVQPGTEDGKASTFA